MIISVCVCNCLEANAQCVFYIFLKHFGNIQTTHTHTHKFLYGLLLYFAPLIVCVFYTN